MIESYTPEPSPENEVSEEIDREYQEEGQKPVEEELSPETYEQAKRYVKNTLTLPEESPEDLPNSDTRWEDLEAFADTLYTQVKKLPVYQELKSELANTSPEELPFQLYERLTNYVEEPTPEDETKDDNGVLLNSIANGYLECAGQVIVASNILEEYSIPHQVIEAPGHTFLLIEPNVEEYIYFDSASGICFSFPQTVQKISDNTEHSSIAQKFELNFASENLSADQINIHEENFNPIYPEGIQFSPREGSSRTYLGNMEAAFDGKPEFEQTNVPQNTEYRDALYEIKKQLFSTSEEHLNQWETELDEQWNEHSKSEAEDLRDQIRERTQVYLYMSEDEETFVTNFTDNLLGDAQLYEKLGTYFPHLRYLSREEHEEKAAQMWRRNQSSE